MKSDNARRAIGIFQVLGLIVCTWGILSPASRALGQSPTELVSFSETVWKFNDSGISLGSGWRAVVYPGETSWASGQGLFGVESSSPYPYPLGLQTPLILGAGRLTYYFRARFNFTGNPASQLVSLTAYVDDGAVFYLNGAEVGRVRMPSGPVTYNTPAQLATPEGTPFLLNLSGASLVQGENLLAVEVHQYSANSSDVVFGASLTVTLAIAPVLTTPADPADRTVLQGRATTLSINATGAPPPSFQWYRNGAVVPGATDRTLALTDFTSSLAGNYFAIASNFLGTVTSRTAVVAYLPDTNAPAIIYAIAQPDLTNIVVLFTEAPEAMSTEDVFNWSLHNAGDGSVVILLTGLLRDGTNLTLTSESPRDPAASYYLQTEGFIGDGLGNDIPLGTQVPVAIFEKPLLFMDDLHSWRYDQSGTDRGNAWTNVVYDDSAWSNGLAIFDGFRDAPDAVPPFCRSTVPSLGETVRTCLSLSNAQNTAQLPAIYFRTHFRFEGDAAHSVLRLRARVDDGAVFYLNGAELLRQRMPAGDILYQTLATETVGTPGLESVEIAARGLVPGDNVLAVGVHQESLTSPDITFGLELAAVVPSLVTPPTVEVGQSGGNIVLSWTPPGGTLEMADDILGPWSAIAPSEPPNRHVAPLNGAPRRYYRVVVP